MSFRIFFFVQVLIFIFFLNFFIFYILGLREGYVGDKNLKIKEKGEREKEKIALKRGNTP